jgi:hypothetical protein
MATLYAVTVYDNNPAGRLHKLLFEFATKSRNQTIGACWASILGMTETPTSDLLTRIGQIYNLPTEIGAEMAMLDSSVEYDADMAMRWRDQVTAAFGISLFSGKVTNEIVPYFGERTLDSLENCSWILNRYRPQPAISESEVERISQLIKELQEEIRSGESLDPELSAFLLYHSHLMARALGDVSITGNAALEAAYDQAVGAVIRRKDLLVHAQESAEKKSVWGKWFDTLMAVAAALQIASSALMLPGQIRQELEGPAPQPPAVVKVIELPGPSGSSAAANSDRPSNDATHHDVGGQKTERPRPS